MLTIKGLLDNRWVDHYRIACALKEYFAGILYTLERVYAETISTPDQKAYCTGILLQQKSWTFSFWLCVLMDFFQVLVF